MSPGDGKEEVKSHPRGCYCTSCTLEREAIPQRRLPEADNSDGPTAQYMRRSSRGKRPRQRRVRTDDQLSDPVAGQLDLSDLDDGT